MAQKPASYTDPDLVLGALRTSDPCPGPPLQGPQLGLILHCHHAEILHNFKQRTPLSVLHQVLQIM